MSRKPLLGKDQILFLNIGEGHSEVEQRGTEVDERFEQIWGGQLALCDQTMQGVMMDAL